MNIWFRIFQRFYQNYNFYMLFQFIPNRYPDKQATQVARCTQEWNKISHTTHTVWAYCDHNRIIAVRHENPSTLQCAQWLDWQKYFLFINYEINCCFSTTSLVTRVNFPDIGLRLLCRSSASYLTIFGISLTVRSRARVISKETSEKRESSRR